MLEKFLMAIVCLSFRGLDILKKGSTVQSVTPQTFAHLQYNVTEQCIPLSPKKCKLESCWLQEKTAQDPQYRQSTVSKDNIRYTQSQVMIKEVTLNAEGMYLNIDSSACCPLNMKLVM